MDNMNVPCRFEYMDYRNVVFDLDDTLIKTDLLHEQIIQILKKAPWQCLLLPFWAAKGRVYLKAQLAKRSSLDTASLPYREELIERIQSEKKRGARLILASASHHLLVEEVAKHLGHFDMVLATKAKNLKGAVKLEVLNDYLQSESFIYYGDSSSDLALWEKSVQAIAINPSKNLERRLRKVNKKVEVIQDGSPKIKLLSKALRVHQWAKNFLIFIPIFASHQVLDQSLWINAIAAFFSFSFMSSTIYVLNDLFDLEADRKHHSKKNRPFASGELSIATGITLLCVLPLLSFLFSFTLPLSYKLILLCYLLINILYSSSLKKVLLLDVILLTVLHTFRIVAGGAATSIEISQWLLSFSLFFFFGLAMVKRYTELSRTSQQKLHGRGYELNDKLPVFVIGVASSIISVLVFSLYLNGTSAEKLYSKPQYLTGTMIVLIYWNCRTWILAHRNLVDDDPVVFALKDKTTWISIAVVGLIFWASI